MARPRHGRKSVSESIRATAGAVLIQRELRRAGIFTGRACDTRFSVFSRNETFNAPINRPIGRDFNLDSRAYIARAFNIGTQREKERGREGGIYFSALLARSRRRLFVVTLEKGPHRLPIIADSGENSRKACQRKRMKVDSDEGETGHPLERAAQ